MLASRSGRHRQQSGSHGPSSRQPNLLEIRRARADYFSAPAGRADRHASVPEKKTLRHSRQRAGSRVSSKSARSQTKPRTAKKPETSASYVYSRPEVPRTDKPSSTQHGVREDATTRKSRSHAKDLGRPHRRKAHQHQLAPSNVKARRSVDTRPKLQRSRSAPQTITSRVAESTSSLRIEEEGSTITSRKHARRNPSLLSSIFKPRSRSATSTPQRPRSVECLTCGADDVTISKAANLDCGHHMCHSCLKRIFTLSVTDPAHMPPRCCTSDHIPLQHVESIFDTKFKLQWNKKYQEYTTKNRLYCPTKGCGSWIHPRHIHRSSRSGRKYGICTTCRAKVCAKCNGKWHTSPTCPEDASTRLLIETAEEKGWQRCYNCRAMVELREGCNHMTCRCTAEFCMLCAARWKTCDCPWFNYSHTNVDAFGVDRLMHMRVPRAPVPIIRRRATDPPSAPARVEHVYHRPHTDESGHWTYRDEMDARRRQEAVDEALARHLQLALALGVDDENHAVSHDHNAAARLHAHAHAPQQQQHIHSAAPPNDVFGNNGAHFLNDDFVRDAADIVVGALERVAAYGRRGERESVRRRSARTVGPEDCASVESGLVQNAFGDASVVGAGSVVPRLGSLRRS